MFKSLAISTLLLAASAGAALAHARLIRASPAVGSTVHQTPSDLTLKFSESIDLSGSSVMVSSSNGPVSMGPLALDRADKRVVHVPFGAKLLRPGVYRVDWGVTSADTHHTEGDFRFRVLP